MTDRTATTGREVLLDDAITAAGSCPDVDAPLPARAQVVVIGAGIIGAAVAHHLAGLGLTDVLVLERHRVSSGTTWHPAGLLAGARAGHALTEMATDTIATYAELQQVTDVGFYRRGCVSLARTPERLTELRHAAAMGRHHDLEVHELAPGELPVLLPLLDPVGLAGAVHFPGDGTVSPGAATLALAVSACARGTALREEVAVEAILTEGGRVTGVRTEQGTVACETVALCAGLWSAPIAATAGVRLGLHAAEHMWVWSREIDGVEDAQPYVRDLDGHFYVRPYRGGLVVGAFEPNGKPRPVESIPDDFSFGEFDPDPEHFDLALERAKERFPALRQTPIRRWLNAPESFTPDAAMLLGEVPEVAGLHVLAGMNSQGVLMGPGAARALAEWIVAGHPTRDTAELHVGRFAPTQRTPEYLFARTRETLGRLYGMHWPHLQPDTARGTRRTPLYEALRRDGAAFGEQSGWERANWFAPDSGDTRYGYSYERPSFFENVAAEHRATREAVSLFDLSSFAKLLVSGPDALATVQRVCSGDLDSAVGKVTYTTVLNTGGGIEVDLTVTRLARDEFLVVAPTMTHPRTLHWFRRHAVGSTVITDVTAAYATLAVNGPGSRALLADLTRAPLDAEAFPFGTAQRIDVAGVPVLAVRVSFVGELGWELYPSTETAAWLDSALMEAGRAHGLRRAGYFALDTLRSEKGFLHWGADIGPADTPLTTGLGFTVAWDKPGGFVGLDALRNLRADPGHSRMLGIALEDPEPLLHHGESVLLDREVVGRVTSGAYGHTLGVAVGRAFIDTARIALIDGAATGLEVDVAGRRVPARVSRRPFYDPSGARMRS